MPLGDVREGVDADQQEEAVCFLERPLEALDGIDCVVGLCRTFLLFLRAWPRWIGVFRRFE